MKEPNKVIHEDEIDLLELARVIWFKRGFILKTTSIFVVLGLLIAFTSKVEYEASCKLMPESQEGMKGNLGGLGGLAGLAGIDLGLGVSGSLTPQLYPEIVKSIPFQLELIHTPIRFENLDSLLSSYTYFTEIDEPSFFGVLAGYTIGLPGKVKGFFLAKEVTFISPTDDLLRLTKDDWKLLEKYRDRINVAVDSKTGIITVTTEMPDPYAAARVTDLVVKKLTSEVTNYKVEKAQVNLEFIRERYIEAEKEYEAKQNQVARFTDQNKNISSSLVQTEYLRLQNEMNITFEVYKGLATQLEQAKIKVKEETPVFTVFEPVRVPEDKSKPKRGFILISLCILGVMISVSLVTVKKIVDER
ncbi:MAG: Wzz/FepE/Etk N-terminal domain-containing protein [Marinoscillum sp.]|uniref:Wzz/FepE/Etk N-terminal domain-containing protein n=1 Tax=Marinoscillum sp. TaxID=2024838 RepID=UPI0032F5FBF5